MFTKYNGSPTVNSASKTYIFLGTGVTSVSGAPLYYQRKKRYLEHKGWKVRIFTFVEGTAALAELKMFEEDIVPELKYLPVFYSRRQRTHILDCLAQKVPACSECVIESNRPLIAPWGELLAERLQAKHILFCLDEQPHSYGNDFQKFIWFKYYRNEVATIYRAIIRLLLGRRRGDKSLDPVRLSVAPTGAVGQVADVSFDDSRILSGRINVLSVGRLDKPYVLPIMREFADYAIANSDLSFNLIIVGHDESAEAELLLLFEAVPNVNLLCMGELHPIPEKLLHDVDVAIATAGAAALCRRFSLCTISIDTVDYQPIGILGYNAKSRTFRLRREPPVPLADLLDMILREKVVQSHFRLPETYGLEEDYSSHFDFIEQSSPEKEYYHFTSSIRDKIIMIAGAIIGLENCNQLFKFFQRSKKK